MAPSTGRTEGHELQEINPTDSHTESQNNTVIDWNTILEKVQAYHRRTGERHNGSMTRSDLKEYLLYSPVTEVPLTNNQVDALLCHVNYKTDQLIKHEDLQNVVNLQVEARTRSALVRHLISMVTKSAPRSQITHSHRYFNDYTDSLLSSVKMKKKKKKDYTAHYSLYIPPFFTILICVAQLCVAAFYGTQDSKLTRQYKTCVTEDWHLLYSSCNKEEAWRFVTYMFLHKDYTHMAVNVVLTLLLGIPLEMVHRFWRIPLLYMGAIILGPLALSTLYSTGQLVGSSGAVFALLAAHFSNTLINWSEMPYVWWRLLLLFIFTAVKICLHVFNLPLKSIVPHASGAVAGFLLGLVALKNIKESPRERALKWIGLVIYLGLIVASIIHIIIQESSDDIVGLLDQRNITCNVLKEYNHCHIIKENNFQNPQVP